MKRAMVVGILAVLIFAAGAKFGVSYFSDVAKSSGNEISTGDFDVGISRDGSRYYDDYRLFSFDNMKPGESRTFTFYIKNRGDYPISSVELLFNVTDLERGKMSKAEALVDNTPDVGELSRYLIVKDFRVSAGDGDIVLNRYIGKSLREINSTPLDIFNGSLTENGVLRVSVTVQLSPSAGNDCLTDVSNVDMIITARQ